MRRRWLQAVNPTEAAGRGGSAVPQDFRFRVNGESHEVNCEPETPLLYVLRNACNVLLDDHCVHSCDTPVSVVGDREVTTVEGLGSASEPGALAEAFDREQAGQCGYCLSGILATTTALLRRVPRPDESQVRVALDGNLCRCGSHNRIVRAVLAAAADSRDVSASGELG
jgi:nicotinate dehydrogenase subunit A